MTVNDLLSFLNLYLGKFSGDTTEEETHKIRALNSAKNILASQLGLPYSEKLYFFDVFEEQEKYPVPTDLISPISLHYDDNYLSIYENINEKVIFEYEYPETIIKKPRTSGVVYWTIDLYNPVVGTSWERSIVVKTNPIKKGTIISNCDSTNNWSVSEDATSLTLDSSKYKSGSNSLKFKIDETISGNSRARITYNSPTPFDLSDFLLNGIFSFDLFIQYTTGITNIVFKWGTNSSNYYFYTNTTNSDNTLYDNNWNKFLCYWNTASTIGNPSPNSVSFFEIEINYNESTFISPQFVNLDSIRIVYPDKFVLRYYSDLIIRSSSGILKNSFTDKTDTALYALADPTLGDLTAKIASYIYKPLVNKEVDNSVAIIKSLSFDLIEPYLIKYPFKTPQYYRGSFGSPKLRY